MTLETVQTSVRCPGIRFSVRDEGGNEVGRAYLYIMKNDLHTAPFGFMEDVFVIDSMRGHGVGSDLVRQVIERAKRSGCYKLVATSRYSRPKVHELYQGLGFTNHGVEFRIDF